MTSIAITAWGAGGGGNGNPGYSYNGKGGGGGLSKGTLAVTGSQALLVGVGEFGAGGDPGSHPGTPTGNGGGCREGGSHGAQGGGFSTVLVGFTAPQIDTASSKYTYRSGSPESTCNTGPGISVLGAGGGGFILLFFKPQNKLKITKILSNNKLSFFNVSILERGSYTSRINI